MCCSREQSHVFHVTHTFMLHTFAVNIFNSSAKGSICALTQFPNSRYFFSKLRYFFQNHVIFKITLFFSEFRAFQNYVIFFSKSRYFQNYVIFFFSEFRAFENYVIFSKLPCF